MAKILKDLIKDITNYEIYGNKDVEVSEIIADSRKVQKGSLFVAIKGLNVDSHKFIPDVIKKGIQVIVGEDEPSEVTRDITYIKVEDSREALGLLASAWFDNPASKLKVIGITGTDGKTTTSNIIYAILKQSGKKMGLISTINAQIGNKQYDTGLHVTNPEPLALHEFLSNMLKSHMEFAVLEVTSHGIAQKRIAGVPFYAAVLTNITHEHIDYHKSFEDYQRTKAQLFKDVPVAVLNADDASFEFVKSVLNSNTNLLSYGINKGTYRAKNIKILDKHMEFMIETPEGKETVTTQLKGEYNVLNILAAAALSLHLGASLNDVKNALSSFGQLEGRMEEIPNERGFKIYVDFAHTPNALEKMLTLLDKQKKGKLIVVFGCGGERDIEKRKLMPQVSTTLADVSIFTAEDPRSEDIGTILAIMTNEAKSTGAKANKDYYAIPERGEAIHFAINKLAKKGDIVVVSGKGHEKSMAYNGIEYPWSDQEAIRSSLKGEIQKIPWKMI